MKHEPQPANSSEWRAAGDACAARGDFAAALQCFDTARTLDPTDAGAIERYAATLAALNRFPEAVAGFRQAIALDPHNKDSHHGLGWSYEQMHRLEQAVSAYHEAARVSPNADGSLNNMGNCLQALGRFDEAHEAYRRAIAAAPQVPLYYRNFVQSKRLTIDDPVFLVLEQFVAHADSLSQANQAEIHFAYGQALSDLGRNDESFAHFLKGNALHRAGVPYNEAETLGLFKHLPDLMTSEMLARKQGLGEPSAAPIFILGMPRSGSTLIEQILASHPQVFGAGERTEFAEALVNCIRRTSDDPLRIDIDAMQGVDATQLGALGADYLHRMRDAQPELQGGSPDNAPHYTHFTDKYPFNFINIGLIHLALPNARFIHSKRAPLQTCLSVFSRIFHDVPFSYDLGELGRYYRAYDALMQHWQRVLPEGVMIEVEYEDLVEDFETNVRRLLAHCRLDWDDRCLAFHQTTRRVSTASAAQVRRPLYKSSLRRWQPERTLLQPLLDGLGPQLAPADDHTECETATAPTDHKS
ncbi:tetratricopeptide repeat-containing sulfotransferase family protein [Paraburkholderia sp. BCC1884]|uniref:tetratricopeptide repeat-containing sulfotransferase family protein n=1 Tax=Paraburkholderia sp. BCC1884 TaxID=2562668 RepID=UPI001181D9A2|nr:sulfotransferase [Paraburkholderia sp. BCC1884]